MAATPAEPKTADNFDPEKAENLEDVSTSIPDNAPANMLTFSALD